MMPKKPKACSSNEILKILGIYLTMRCNDSKRSNDMMCMEPNGLVPSYKWHCAFTSVACSLCTHIIVGEMLTSM